MKMKTDCLFPSVVVCNKKFCWILNLFHVGVKHVLRAQFAFLQFLCQLREGQRQDERRVGCWMLEDTHTHTHSQS